MTRPIVELREYASILTVEVDETAIAQFDKLDRLKAIGFMEGFLAALGWKGNDA